jgi:hypothetical protein
MKTNTKILLGVGAIALAYYLFKDKFNKPQTTTSSKSNDANFSNLTAPSACGNYGFCPPSRPYCITDNGRQRCSSTPKNTRPIKDIIVGG